MKPGLASCDPMGRMQFRRNLEGNMQGTLGDRVFITRGKQLGIGDALVES